MSSKISLILETSHERGLVAFAASGTVVCSLPLPFGLQSASSLFPTLQQGMQQLSLSTKDLEKIIVSIGPGSFTGIRIGIAAAKGLSAATSIPLWSVCSLYGFVAPGRSLTLLDAHGGGAFILEPGGTPRLVSRDILNELALPYDTIIGPSLSRFSFPQQQEVAPDPSALLAHALPAPKNNPIPLYLHTHPYTQMHAKVDNVAQSVPYIYG